MPDQCRRRVPTAVEAAKFLGVSRQRVQQYTCGESGWPHDDLRTAEGFGVVSIALAKEGWRFRQNSGRSASAAASEQEKAFADANA